jgi:uncharacterized protein YkwD
MDISQSNRSTQLYSFIYRFALINTCLFAPVLFGAASAQSVQPRPVARLITGSDDAAAYSRPRRVQLSVSHAPEARVADPIGPSSFEAAKSERRAFAVTNEVRAKNGLSALTWDEELCRMARAHSEKMARLGFFSHQTPEGLRLRDRARAAGILRFKVLGENIAYNQGFDDPGAFAVERWLTSSVHRENILSREFRASAVGSFIAADGRVYLTQVFILR